MGDFQRKVAAWAEKTKRTTAQATTDLIVDLSTKIVLSTPVGNPSLWEGDAPEGYIGGTLRNNWFASIGSPNIKSPLRTPRGGTGNGALAQILAQSVNAPGMVYYLVNVMPYARRIEYEGHSSQAPAGMVRTNLMAFQKALDDAVRKNKES